MDTVEMIVPWDTAARSWADYTGNADYSAAAQIVMDVCADCLTTMRRLPTLAELRCVSKLQDHEIRNACDVLRAMGWERYAAVADAIPANPKPRVLSGKPRRKAVIPIELRWAVWERDDFTCRTCGRRTRLSVDHIVPESAGGPTTMNNLQTLCKRCNCRKGTKGPDEWQP